jgi:hypothetical protein
MGGTTTATGGPPGDATRFRFLPSVHGSGSRTFPPDPPSGSPAWDPRRLGIGDASGGLCGGMALTA